MSGADSIDAALGEATRRLTTAGIAHARLDARLLVDHVLESREPLSPGRHAGPLDEGRRERLHRLVARRAAREPLAHITGRREFWSLSFGVTRHTLVPRPDSETLIEAVLDWSKTWRGAAAVLDLGIGSGCLLAALLSERPEWRGVGVDIDASALAVAQSNLGALDLDGRSHLILGDWSESLAARFDVVLCNPPYLAEGDWPDLEPEVAAFEPRIALAGGTDGLACYRRIAPQLGELLANRGAAFIEVGAGQASPVTDLLCRHDLQVIDIKRDLAGIPRCLVARRCV